MSLERIPSLFDRTIRSLQTRTTTDTSLEKKVHVGTGEVILAIANIVIPTLSGLCMVYLFRQWMRSITGESDMPKPSVVTGRLANILRKREHAIEYIPYLSQYELQMAEEILDPDDIEVSFADVGGLDTIKQEIYQLAVLPLVQPELFTGKLIQPTKGILLFGRPGTGKTMLAKAIAKEAEAIFLPLHLSKILSKWVGESNKLVAATFSLATKLQPAIIFIDELDTFLKANNSETAYLDAIKAEFLTLWDGIGTSQSSRVLVLGATNKPHAIDPAILRRLPRAFPVPLPDAAGRKSILELLLKDENILPEAFDFIEELSGRLTSGYSGSDLKELCKAAAMIPVQELSADFVRKRVAGITASHDATESAIKDAAQISLKPSLRPISINDLLTALDKVKQTGAVAMDYGKQAAAEDRRQQGHHESNDKSLKSILNLLRSLSQVSAKEGIDDDDIPSV